MNTIRKLIELILEQEFLTTHPPQYGYHVTLLERLPKIMKQGLVLPKKTSRKRTYGRNWIYLFISPNQAKTIANDISLARDKDWVLLQVSELRPKFLMPDDDYGETWNESLKNTGTFAYADNIPPSNIKIIAKALGTEEEYHDEFENL